MSIKIVGIEPQTACGILQIESKFYQFNYPYDEVLDLEPTQESDLQYLSYFKLVKSKSDLPSVAFYLADKYKRLKLEQADEYCKPRHLASLENIFSKGNDVLVSKNHSNVRGKSGRVKHHSISEVSIKISSNKSQQLFK